MSRRNTILLYKIERGYFDKVIKQSFRATSRAAGGKTQIRATASKKEEKEFKTREKKVNVNQSDELEQPNKFRSMMQSYRLRKDVKMNQGTREVLENHTHLVHEDAVMVCTSSMRPITHKTEEGSSSKVKLITVDDKTRCNGSTGTQNLVLPAYSEKDLLKYGRFKLREFKHRNSGKFFEDKETQEAIKNCIQDNKDKIKDRLLSVEEDGIISFFIKNK